MTSRRRQRVIIYRCSCRATVQRPQSAIKTCHLWEIIGKTFNREITTDRCSWTTHRPVHGVPTLWLAGGLSGRSGGLVGRSGGLVGRSGGLWTVRQRKDESPPAPGGVTETGLARPPILVDQQRSSAPFLLCLRWLTSQHAEAGHPLRPASTNRGSGERVHAAVRWRVKKNTSALAGGRGGVLCLALCTCCRLVLYLSQAIVALPESGSTIDSQNIHHKPSEPRSRIITLEFINDFELEKCVFDVVCYSWQLKPVPSQSQCHSSVSKIYLE